MEAYKTFNAKTVEEGDFHSWFNSKCVAWHDSYSADELKTQLKMYKYWIYKEGR